MSEVVFVDKIGGAGSQDHIAVLENVQRAANCAELVSLAVSGPGGEAGRVTDDAIRAIKLHQLGNDSRREFAEIKDRLVAHATPLGKKAIAAAVDTVTGMEAGLLRGTASGWVVAGPERYMAQAYTDLLHDAGRETAFVDPTEQIRRDNKGAIRLEDSARGLAERLNPRIVTVVPGSLGVDARGEFAELNDDRRGFTDPTGLVLAEAQHYAQGGRPVEYRLIKDDVDAILRMPPGLGRKPGIAHLLSSIEALTLAAAGNGVVNTTALELSLDAHVSLRVCSWDTINGGTIIVPTRQHEAHESVAGIAVQDVVSYTVDDIRMEHQNGVVRDITDIFEQLKIPLVNVKTGTGVVATYITRANYASRRTDIEAAFGERYGNKLTIRGGEGDELCIVTLAGGALSSSKPKRAKVEYDATTSIAAAAGVELIDSWDSPPPEANAVYLVVPSNKKEAYASALYDHYFSRRRIDNIMKFMPQSLRRMVQFG